MKKFLIVVTVLISVLLIYDLLFYEFGFFIDFHPNKEVTTFVKTDGKTILLNKDGTYEEFEIKGVDLGSGIPGKFSTEYAIDEETYLRWFKYIQDMGANTIRIYTMLNDDFYNAFYKYNKNNEKPLYLIQGLWVNDYILNSRLDAYDDKFLGQALKDSKKLVDIIHGKRQATIGAESGTGFYFHDISDWVIGYILGVEWEERTVAFTDDIQRERSPYQGKYMYTSDDASAFEAMLAQLGDKIIEYESTRYKNQRLVAFANWPSTDPFEYSEEFLNYIYKYASVDVEHIKSTDKFISGQFASYHIYPYFPDYLNYDPEYADYTDENGVKNTYRAYLTKINKYHTMPVVISEFGIPSSRGMADYERNVGRNQGRMSEDDQGKALVDCYNDIRAAGIKNAIIFTWQDEWFKRTWNTMHAVNLNKTAYWSDYQTNEQFFGLLTFDPGEERSISYVDGDIEEWRRKDLVYENNGLSISHKYDEKFMYFYIHQDGYKDNPVPLYIPIDITPKSGATKSEEHNINFARAADFLIVIDGKNNSRILVQERYNTIEAMFGYELYNRNSYVNPPAIDSSKFQTIDMIIRYVGNTINYEKSLDKYETGKLTYGNANPDSKYYNSLADFIINGDDIEIRIPYGLLNFSDPSNMKIHDDYYKYYGAEELGITEMYIGVGDGKETIPMNKVSLKGWKKDVTYHERLKKSYYYIKEIWGDTDD